jgi:hypothetical protein
MEAKLLSVLLSWTVNLSSYSHLGEAPEILFKPHVFFVDIACNGNEKCDAVAWYDNNGTIFLDARLEGNTDAFTRSVIVHELVHYLQDISGKYPKWTAIFMLSENVKPIQLKSNTLIKLQENSLQCLSTTLLVTNIQRFRLDRISNLI